jgi:transcriptional regulator with PAS, ATPase and Fis domain
MEHLRRQLSGKHTFSDIITKNDRMRRLIETPAMVAPTDMPVLIEGECGTEKELVAKVIHATSGRQKVADNRGPHGCRQPPRPVRMHGGGEMSPKPV